MLRSFGNDRCVRAIEHVMAGAAAKGPYFGNTVREG